MLSEAKHDMVAFLLPMGFFNVFATGIFTQHDMPVSLLPMGE